MEPIVRRAASLGVERRPRCPSLVRACFGAGLALSFLLSPLPAAAQAHPPSGASLFAQHCASCHGADGHGDGRAARWLASPPPDLHRARLDAYSNEQLVERLLDGRQLPIEIRTAAFRDRARDTESVVTYLERLPAVDWASVDRGREVFALRCEGCHGAYGNPTGVTPPQGVRPARDLGAADYQKAISDTELLDAVRHGRRGMPALIPPITPAEAYPLLSFVRHLSRGFEVYDQTCVHCHGDRGQGVGSLGETLRLPTTWFDAAYFERADRDKLRVDAWHMLGEHQPRMPHFRSDLTRGEAARVIDFLRASRPAPPTPETGAAQ